MIFEVLGQSPLHLSFRTHARARRGRGVLFATAPFVVYVLFCIALFVLATDDLTLWERVKSVARWSSGVAGGLALVAFFLGRRVQDVFAASQEGLEIRHTPAWGPARVDHLRYADLRSLAIEPSLRSLGADVLLVAITLDGQRHTLLEGEPHSPQVHEIGQKLAFLSKLPLQSRLEP